MRRWVRAAGLATGLALGCAGGDIFVCSEQGECNDGRDAGTCQPSGYCSFPDEGCSSGERYGDHAGGGLAGHCVPAPSGDTGTDDTSGTTSTSTTSGSSTTSTTTDDSATSTTVGVDDTGASTTTGGGGLPPGSSCSRDAECDGYCYVTGVLGGLCGECSEHAHCPLGGCNAPNPLAEPPEGAVCGTGQIGDGCGSDDDCDAGVCATIVDIPGVIALDTCSECAPELGVSACTGGRLCNPNLDVVELGGYFECVNPGSVPMGGTCDPNSPLACSSDICATADVMGLWQVGVCSECDGDEDCAGDGVCSPPEVELNAGTVAGMCM